jgi:hypothetical protein
MPKVTKLHPKNHNCKTCVEKRFQNWVTRAHFAGLGAPTNREKLVPVRQYTVKAHYRRHPSYLKHDQLLRQAIIDYVNGMIEIHERAKNGTLLNKRRAGR